MTHPTSSRTLPALTYSMIRDYDCPQKFYQRHILNLRPIAVAEALSIGRLFHGGREHGEEWAVSEIRKGRILSQFDADNQAKQESMVVGMLRGAALAFKDVKVEREPEWFHPIVNPDTGRRSRRFWSAGKGDGIQEYASRRAVIIEEKTKGGSVNEADVTKLDMDMQVLNEVSNIQRDRGVIIDRVLYRYIIKPYIKQTKSESCEDYCRRLESDYQTRLDFYFHEIEIVVDQDRVVAWEQDLWRIANSIGHALKNDLWYHNTSRCAEWGGCAYLPLCRGEDAAHMFEVAEPNPELSKEGAHVGIKNAVHIA